jgi:hypothetical protein
MRDKTIERIAIGASGIVLAALAWFWTLQVLGVIELLSLA